MLECELGELVDRCVPNTSCESCETLTVESECEPIADTCVCDDSDAIRCDPDSAVNACPMGFTCSAGCLCEPIPNCDAGFAVDGSVSSCGEAQACCEQWSEADGQCEGYDSESTCLNELQICPKPQLSHNAMAFTQPAVVPVKRWAVMWIRLRDWP